LEYARLIVVIEAIQAAMTCLWTFPSRISSFQLTLKARIELFLVLCEQLEKYTIKAVKYRKHTREKEKGTQESQPSDLLSPRLPTDSFHRIIRPVVGVERCSTDCAEVEAEFLTKCLELLNSESENADLDEEEYQLRQRVWNSPAVEFLRRHIRERHIRVLEGILQYSEDLAVAKFLPSFLSSLPPGDDRCCLSSISRVRDKFRSLYSSILLDFMMMRTLDRDQVEPKSTMQPSLIFSSSSISNHQSCKQLALRGMLGCVRLESFLGKMLSRTMNETRSSLVEMFVANPELNPQSLSVTTGLSRALGFHAKKFVTLLLNLHETDRGDAPLIVLILGEIAQLMTAEETELLKDVISQECSEKLSRSSFFLADEC
jgi:hypothetical protein